jgi:hypothetical protein
MRGSPASASVERIPTPEPTEGEPERPQVERRPTQFPIFTPRTTRVYGGGSGSDGVFANLAAKPEVGEKTEEHPPVRLLDNNLSWGNDAHRF